MEGRESLDIINGPNWDTLIGVLNSATGYNVSNRFSISLKRSLCQNEQAPTLVDAWVTNLKAYGICFSNNNALALDLDGTCDAELRYICNDKYNRRATYAFHAFYDAGKCMGTITLLE